MAEDLFMLTDPARELAELLTTLQSGDTAAAGSRFLAKNFEVEAWSDEFYKIISTIMDRLTGLTRIIEDLSLDEDYRSEMIDHIEDIATAFSQEGLHKAWNTFGGHKVAAHNVLPLKGISGLVRQQVAYRKLSDQELNELVEIVDSLLDWLKNHQLSYQEFIRQALIEGLENLRFRLLKLKWLGWGYVLESVREVIAAYMFLERQEISPQRNPDAEAILMKVGSAIKSIYAKIQTVKTATETADWLIKAYAAATVAQQAYPSVKGILTSN